MNLEEQINYIKSNNIAIKSNTKEIINELNKVYIKSNNVKLTNNNSEIEYIKNNFTKLSIEGLKNRIESNNRNNKSIDESNKDAIINKVTNEKNKYINESKSWIKSNDNGKGANK